MDIDNKSIKPYGDTLNDGSMQLSFTLPLPKGAHSTEVARRFVAQMGMNEVEVVLSNDIGEGFTFFVVYAKTSQTIDSTQVHVQEIVSKKWSREVCNEKIDEYFHRKVTVVGACIGEDAHTVGIDAIMNMKGYNGHYGLERYKGFKAINLGAQVTPEILLKKAVELNADAILVSQIVTQRDIHIQNLTEFVELADTSGIRKNTILIAGGPRIDNGLALELGYDAGFGRGSFADDVASYIIQELHRRLTGA
ncbi:MAG: cobalamin-dependent protein [Deltaproteobacteria bacterium]|nr:cobalamin-dependent protein [Deltaproteobacteria bacterium]